MSAGPRSSQASLWPMRISSMSRLAFSTTLVSCLNPSPWPCLPAPPTQDLSSAGHKGSGAGAGKTWDSEPTTGLPRSSASASFLGPGRAALLRGGPAQLAALRCCCSVLRLGEVPRMASLLRLNSPYPHPHFSLWAASGRRTWLASASPAVSLGDSLSLVQGPSFGEP